MQDLYAERIAKEADPRFFEEDSGLTDLDVGGLSKPATAPSGATVVDRNKLPAGNATQVNGTQLLAPPSKSSPLPRVLVAVVLVLGLSVGGYLATRPDVKPVVEVVPPPVTVIAEPTPQPKPLVVHIVSEPSGANVELAGANVGQTPFSAHVERVKLPVAVRLSAEGYEPAEATLTDMTGPTLSLALKKKVVVVKPPAGGSGGKNPDIKTSR